MIERMVKMRKLIGNRIYSMDNGYLYLPGTDIKRLKSFNISSDDVFEILKGIGIDSNLYDRLVKKFREYTRRNANWQMFAVASGFNENDLDPDTNIMRWATMLTIATRQAFFDGYCVSGRGFTVKIVREGLDYSTYINNTLCFKLEDTFEFDDINTIVSYIISYMDLDYLNSITHDFVKNDPIMDALFSPYRVDIEPKNNNQQSEFDKTKDAFGRPLKEAYPGLFWDGMSAEEEENAYNKYWAMVEHVNRDIFGRK